MKSYYQDKYSSIPATRRSVNKLLSSSAVSRIKTAAPAAVTDNSTGVAATGWKAVPNLRDAPTHVTAQADLALQSDFYVIAGKVNNATKVLAGAINSFQTVLDSTRLITGGNGTVATAGTVPALEKTVDGSTGGTAVVVARREANAVVATLRDNLSTLLLAFNRVQDQSGRRRMMDYGDGKASSTLALTAMTAAGTAVDASSNLGAGKAQVDAAFTVLVDNIAALAKAINDYRTWALAQ